LDDYGNLVGCSTGGKKSEDAAVTSVTSFLLKSSALMVKETLPVERMTEKTCGCRPWALELWNGNFVSGTW